MKLLNQKPAEFDVPTVKALTNDIQAALIDANSASVKIATTELSRILFNQDTNALIIGINTKDPALLQETVLTTLNAVDSLIGAAEDFPGSVDLYRAGFMVGQMFSALKYRFESAEDDGRYHEAAISAEMAAHTLERAAKTIGVIEQHVSIGLLKQGKNFVHATLRGILDHKNDTVVISDSGETRRYIGARQAFLEAAGDNYDLASKMIIIEAHNPIEATKEALDLRATAAVVLKEAGVSRRMRLKALGDCSVLAQTIVRGEMGSSAAHLDWLRNDREMHNTSTIPPDLNERAHEITEIAIANAKARFDVFRFTPLSVDGILNA